MESRFDWRTLWVDKLPRSEEALQSLDRITTANNSRKKAVPPDNWAKNWRGHILTSELGPMPLYIVDKTRKSREILYGFGILEGLITVQEDPFAFVLLTELMIRGFQEDFIPGEVVPGPLKIRGDLGAGDFMLYLHTDACAQAGPPQDIAWLLEQPLHDELLMRIGAEAYFQGVR